MKRCLGPRSPAHRFIPVFVGMRDQRSLTKHTLSPLVVVLVTFGAALLRVATTQTPSPRLLCIFVSCTHMELFACFCEQLLSTPEDRVPIVGRNPPPLLQIRCPRSLTWWGSYVLPVAATGSLVNRKNQPFTCRRKVFSSEFESQLIE